ncbi:MAG: hypothetical protein FWD75_11335, partial [Propionibacteriaceae bacterium]|nr:hypothetical protein [Propionibacteriaceae bacterium]
MNRKLTKYVSGAAIVAVVTMALASVSGVAEAAQPAKAPVMTPSTPVTVTLVEGQTYAYVLNVKQANPGQMMLAENAVRDAGGSVVQSW